MFRVYCTTTTPPLTVIWMKYINKFFEFFAYLSDESFSCEFQLMELQLHKFIHFAIWKKNKSFFLKFYLYLSIFDLKQ